MESNSIKDNLSKEDMISDILLCLGADIHRERIYLLVEGEDDIKFLRPFLSDNIYIYESYDGKNGVEYIVSECFSTNARVIGIRDRDYQIVPISDKIFYYDYGCMEMMILKNDEVFKNLCAEYYKGNISIQQLRIDVFRELKYLSIIRMYNERENWGKKIRGISIDSAWNSNRKRLDNEAILSRINQINGGFFKDDILQKIEQEYRREWTEEDFYSNTQGHDFFMLYAAICNQYKTKGIKYTEIEASGRCIFRQNDFIQTNLYEQLSEYENLHKFKICNGNPRGSDTVNRKI